MLTIQQPRGHDNVRDDTALSNSEYDIVLALQKSPSKVAEPPNLDFTLGIPETHCIPRVIPRHER